MPFTDEFCMAQRGPSWPSDIFAAECSSAGKLGEIRPASRHAHGHGIRHPILTDHAVLTQVTSVDPWTKQGYRMLQETWENEQ